MGNEAWHAVAACDAPATAAFDVAQVVGDVAATLPETAAAQESAAALEVIRAQLAGFAAVAASLSVEAAKQVEEKENSLVHPVFPDNAFAEGECKDVGQPFSLQPECYDGLDIENLSFKHTLKKGTVFPSITCCPSVHTRSATCSLWKTTKPKPRGLCVSRAYITSANITFPYFSKYALNSARYNNLFQ